VALSGVEAPIAVVAVVVLAALVRRGGTPTTGRGAWCGALAGVAVLARFDAAVIVAVIFLDLVLIVRRRPNRPWSAAVAFAAVAAVVASPWLVWLLLHGGLPDSARALRILRANHVAIGDNGVGAVFGSMVSALINALVPLASRPPLLVGGAAVVVVLLVVAGLRSEVGRRWCRSWAGLIAGVLVLEVLYATVLGGTRTWYHLYAAAVLWLVFIPAGLASVCAGASDRRIVVAVGVVGVVAVVLLVVGSERSLTPQEADKYLATQLAGSHLPGRTRVGAFNSGVYTFFLEERVVNLDGVVNPGVQPALRHRALCPYLRKHGVRWFLDARQSLAQLQYFAPGLHIGQTFDLSAESRGIDRYPIEERQVLASLDTSGC
jgi:hypothetical protein